MVPSLSVEKTTVYLPADLKVRLERIARARGVSEASLIRDAISEIVEKQAPPRPTLPLFSGEDPTLSERVDDELAGFGA